MTTSLVELIKSHTGRLVIIEIPMLPPRECSGNYHGTVRARISAVRTWRNAAFYAAVDARNRRWLAGWPPRAFPLQWVRIAVEFVVGRHGMERDLDNAIAGLKPALDGVVNADVLMNDEAPMIEYIMPFIYTIAPNAAPLTKLALLEKG